MDTYAFTRTRTPEDVCHLYRDRKASRGALLGYMQEIQSHYNGDIVVPLPEMDDSERSFVSNNFVTGIDAYAQRIASVVPQITCPPIDARKKTSSDRADVRRKTYYGWWEQNQMPLLLRQRARWLVGYSSAPVEIKPDFKRGIPRWDERNPLTCFPAETTRAWDMTPEDCIFAVTYTLAEVRRQWPDKWRLVADEDTRPDTKFTVLKYTDPEQVSAILLAPENNGMARMRGLAEYVDLGTMPNRIGECHAVVPGRITLDRPAGQFDQLIGPFKMRAKLMAMELLAVQQGVFPDVYLTTTDPNATPGFIQGPHKGASGLVNILTPGTAVTSQTIQPGFATLGAIDRLERTERIQAGISPEFGGESGTNIRTGRRGDAVMSAVVDPQVQEAQDILQESLAAENRRACAVAKAYFGGAAKSFYVGWKGAKGHVDYVPSRDFETDHNIVTYAATGVDINNLNIELGQLSSTGMMSLETARKLHPHVQDPDLEGDLIVREGLQRATLAALEQQAASGAMGPADMARISQLVVESNMDYFSAILKVQEEAQARQATPVPQGDPASMPGLAPPGAGAESPVIPEASAGISNASALLGKLRSIGSGAAGNAA